MRVQPNPDLSRPDLCKFEQTFREFECITNNMGLGLDLKKSNPNMQSTIPI